MDGYKRNKELEENHQLDSVRQYMNGAIYVESTFLADYFQQKTPSLLKLFKSSVLCTCDSKLKACGYHKNKNKNGKVLIRNASSIEPIDLWQLKKHPQKRCKSTCQSPKKKENKSSIQLTSVDKTKENANFPDKENAFRLWLQTKLNEEQAKKMQKRDNQKSDVNLQETYEQRQLESDMRFQLWLKQKKQYFLEKQIAAQLCIMKEQEEKELQLARAKEKYEEWLRKLPKNTKKPPRVVCSKRSTIAKKINYLRTTSRPRVAKSIMKKLAEVKQQSADNDFELDCRSSKTYLNGAICIQSSSDPDNFEQDQISAVKYAKDIALMKRVSCCCCTVEDKNCPSHQNDEDRHKNLSNKSSDMKVTIKHVKSSERNNVSDTPKIKLNATAGDDDSNKKEWDDEQNKLKQQSNEESFKKWLKQKQLCKIETISEKDNECSDDDEEETKRKEQEKLSRERENFKRWLADKHKLQEKEKLAQIRKKEKEEKAKKYDEEKRELENRLKYQLWLKRKEQNKLEQTIEKKMQYLKRMEEKQSRVQENQAAYQQWLKRSANKPKPLPLNQGLDSLRSVTSVTYINPQPWVPNIEMNESVEITP